MATDAERNRGVGAYSTPGVDTPGPGSSSGIITSGPLVSFNTHNIDPPAAEYIGPGDRFQFVVSNSDANVNTMQFFARILLAATGQVSYHQWNITTGIVRAVQSLTVDLPEGYLLSLTAIGLGGTNRGRCYVQAIIVRGSVAGANAYIQLISDYFVRGHNPAWPVGEYISSVEGAGWARGIAGTIPGAGNNLTETVPTGARWRLKSLRFRFTTSATVATRSMRVTLGSAGGSYWLGIFNISQAASTIQDYSVGIGISPLIDAAAAAVNAGLPENLMFAADTLATSVVNIQAGDLFSGFEYAVEEWIEL